MNSRRVAVGLLLGCCLICESGCAIYDPYRVWRFGADYNTERQLSMQWSVQEHLPPKHVAVRLMKWRYNPGTTPHAASYAIPANSPVNPITPAPTGVLPGNVDDELEQAAPPSILPPIPPYPQQPIQLPSRKLVEPYGPSASGGTTSRSTSATPTSWMFGSP